MKTETTHHHNQHPHQAPIEGEVIYTYDHRTGVGFSHTPDAPSAQHENTYVEVDATRRATEARQIIYDITSPRGKPEAPRGETPTAFRSNLLGDIIRETKVSIHMAKDNREFKRDLREAFGPPPPGRIRRSFQRFRQDAQRHGWMIAITDRIFRV
jgi:hypothetical protein